jgi:hypothetical protein
MPKIPELVATYIEAQPESVQPALHEIHAMLAATYPQAKVELYVSPKGAFPVYKDGETWLGGFSMRARGPMVYMMDAEVVAKYKPQLGTLADGKTCVLYKPTKTLDKEALQRLFSSMLKDAAARR